MLYYTLVDIIETFKSPLNMTKYTITINNRETQFSGYRLKQMLGTKQHALELRGLHGFLKKIGLGNLQTVKTKQLELETLWEQLHTDVRSTTYSMSDNVTCLIIFNKMKQLFDSENPDNKPQFKIKETTTNYGFSVTFSFSINDHCILERPANPKNSICKLLLERFTDKDGVLIDGIDSQSIYDEFDNPTVRNVAANNIQKAVKNFNKMLKNKQENGFGYKELVYKNQQDDDDKLTVIISPNKRAFHIPIAKPDRRESGTFKQVIGRDDQSVLLESIPNGEPNDYSDRAYTANEIEEILIKLGIEKYLVVAHEFSPDKFITRNSGKYNLYQFRKNHEMVFVNYFKEILGAIKTLNENGYAHLDIKPDNIQVRKIGDTIDFSIIDLDSFSSILDVDGVPIERISSPFGSKLFTTKPLLNRIIFSKDRDKGENLRQKLLQTFDEYAFALTILWSVVCIYISENYYYSRLKITKPIEDFILSHIKDAYQQNFRDLILNPLDYAEKMAKSGPNIYLFDMFNFPQKS